MDIRYAILMDGDKAVHSSDFLNLGDPIREDKMVELIDNHNSEQEKNIGHHTINNGGELLYFRKQDFTVILVGEDLGPTVSRKMEIVLDDYSKAESKSSNIFIKSLYKNLQEGIMKKYFIPILMDTYSENVDLSKELWNFITKIDGLRTLEEICSILDIPWFDIRFIASQLFTDGFVTFRIEIDKSSIFQITTRGINILSNSRNLAFELKDHWEELVRPILQLIDGETSLNDIQNKLKNKITFEEDIKFVIKLLLYEDFIKPVPMNFYLAIFLQKLYLTSYNILKSKIGQKMDKIMEEVFNNYPDLRMMLPNFTRNMYKIDVLVMLIEGLNIDGLLEFVSKYKEPLDKIFFAVEEITGKSLIQSTKIKLEDIMRQNNEKLIAKYNLNDIIR